jgi:hypothetical protein
VTGAAPYRRPPERDWASRHPWAVAAVIIAIVVLLPTAGPGLVDGSLSAVSSLLGWAGEALISLVSSLAGIAVLAIAVIVVLGALGGTAAATGSITASPIAPRRGPGPEAAEDDLLTRFG